VSNAQLAEHFFRHEYARTIAILGNRFGLENIEIVEDAVQGALLKALETWTISGLPDNPSAWVYRVAYNHVLDVLRRNKNQDRLQNQISFEALHQVEQQPQYLMDSEVQDDLLRMLFACCNDNIGKDSQLVLALKVLCGFSVREIALRLFISEDSTYKRLSRARKQFRCHPLWLDLSPSTELSQRLAAVHMVLYLLFTEGHLSLRTDYTLRRELCDEAIRLATLLVNHPVGQTPQSYALLALMHLHVARMSAREDANGGLLLLSEQDRSAWNQQDIAAGMSWLAKAAEGDVFSRYHAEAGVAAEHCLAPSYATTRWHKITEYYELLERTVHSPVHTLNRVVALAEWRGAASGLAVLNNMQAPEGLVNSFWWAAIQADLHMRSGDSQTAGQFAEQAYTLAPTSSVRLLLQRRLQSQQQM